MQHTLEEFVRALRAVDVRVSPAEAIDAARAVRQVGYADRELFKDALCVALAKSADEVVRFDQTFETFFTREAFALPPEDAGEPPPEPEPAKPPAPPTLSSPRCCCAATPPAWRRRWRRPPSAPASPRSASPPSAAA
jgi:uncharacterized protein with von Willebrand factor type A (vWA) domain